MTNFQSGINKRMQQFRIPNIKNINIFYKSIVKNEVFNNTLHFGFVFFLFYYTPSKDILEILRIAFPIKLKYNVNN